MSAVHEARHVVVADTVGAFIHHAQVTSSEHFGEGDVAHVDLEMPGAAEVLFPEHLIILAADFQASFFWPAAAGSCSRTWPRSTAP
ncbi:hypothetical protein [Streptomyces endophytica]|uniref:Uncharacterized protein n=1 Tax=Streptomyces endophytica TaxID=2991496 RepID=A0ABY6PHZ6_9ACTN|nr:hypothetical protein [Streptomyces endophytica]UZJ33503.1 hypothetical protein OJ254_28525 [Streptomyces endophytica]